MHKFMRTVGFSMYQKKQDMAKLLKRLVKEAEMTGRLAEQEGSRFCELRTEVAPGMGVAMIGEMSPKGVLLSLCQEPGCKFRGGMFHPAPHGA